MIQGSGYAEFEVSIVYLFRKSEMQSRRCAKITQTRQLWRQVVFRVFYRRSRKSIYRYGEWVCLISGLYRFSIEENKKAIKEICRNNSTVRPPSLKHRRQSKRYAKNLLTRQFLRQGIFRIPSSKKQKPVFIDTTQGVGMTNFRSLSFFYENKTGNQGNFQKLP